MPQIPHTPDPETVPDLGDGLLDSATEQRASDWVLALRGTRPQLYLRTTLGGTTEATSEAWGAATEAEALAVRATFSDGDDYVVAPRTWHSAPRSWTLSRPHTDGRREYVADRHGHDLTLQVGRAHRFGDIDRARTVRASLGGGRWTIVASESATAARVALPDSAQPAGKKKAGRKATDRLTVSAVRELEEYVRERIASQEYSGGSGSVSMGKARSHEIANVLETIAERLEMAQ